MKIYWVVMLAGLTFFAAVVFAEEENGAVVPLETTGEKFSYAMGIDVATALKRLETDIDMKAFMAGVNDSYAGTPARLSAEEIAAVKKEVAAMERSQREQKMKALAEKNLAAGMAFLAGNKKKEDVVTTASGLQYKILRRGSGDIPGPEDTVRVQYRAMKIDGTEYDSSYQRGKAPVVPVKGVIPGWSEALQLMNEGSKYRVFMPPRLAYGDRQVGPHGEVKPNETLIFDVELISIEKKKAKAQEPIKGAE